MTLYRNNKGFTLIEMLIVLMIISTLLLVMIPHISKNNGVVQSKGCEAFIKLAESQAFSYKMENGTFPTSMETLATEGYLQSSTCPGGESLLIGTDGTVTVQTSESS
ncbi:competence type IV pilus major pilin ComGC [Pontibacillus salicampi]|uniref:ComG operon protein 3 n=1 Tax=Pontibacillus salicampi TaxID=1449801 RepID=A0ABV6LJR1_9BACI